MFEALKNFTDELLGRGAAATTIPVFDGPLKPNQLLENATVVAELEAAEDLATDGKNLYIADGERLLCYLPDKNQIETLQTFDQRITAVAALDSGQIAVAVGGESIQLFEHGKFKRKWEQAGAVKFRAINALRFAGTKLVATQGSEQHECGEWCRDLLEKNATGSVLFLDVSSGEASVAADGLQYCFGAVRRGLSSWVSESWKHRIMRIDGSGACTSILENLPGYPSRMSPSASGGVWLSVFACRTQLVEFVLREPEYRARMMAEVDPQFWIAPALSSGHSFLEPLQGAGVKQMGILKPWAPPRSYGLVVHLNADGQPTHSLHSRVGGRHHGISALVEIDRVLYVLSKGANRLLSIPLTVIEQGQ